MLDFTKADLRLSRTALSQANLQISLRNRKKFKNIFACHQKRLKAEKSWDTITITIHTQEIFYLF